MALDEIQIINRACGEIGASPIQSFDDDTPSSRNAKSIYPSERDFMASLYPWSFFIKRVQLTKISSPPNVLGWTSAFALPAEAMGTPLSISPDRDYDDTKFSEFAVEPGRVLTNLDLVYAKIKYLSAPDQWDGAFVAALVRALGARFAFSLRGDKTLRESMLREAYGPPEMRFKGGMVGAAIDADARGNPPKSLMRGSTDPLTAAMRGGRPQWR